MTMLASQITSLTIVYSIVYSGVNQRKHQSSASLAIVREIHRGPVNFPHKWPVKRKMFPFDDVIMVVLLIAVSEFTGDPLHSRALAHSRAALFTQPCPHCSHSRAPGEQWARLCVFTLQGCVQAARLCSGSPVELGHKCLITRNFDEYLSRKRGKCSYKQIEITRHRTRVLAICRWVHL